MQDSNVKSRRIVNFASSIFGIYQGLGGNAVCSEVGRRGSLSRGGTCRHLRCLVGCLVNTGYHPCWTPILHRQLLIFFPFFLLVADAKLSTLNPEA